MIAPIVDVTWLADHPDAVVVDVRWYLDGRSGRDAYVTGHLPGAVFIDLNTALASPPSWAEGRHPLPEPIVFAEAMADAGISHDSVVVAYDDAGGASAGRLVWLLRSIGVGAALLDGGIGAWAGELTTEVPQPARGHFGPRSWRPERLASMNDADTAPLVIDSRAPERYRGESEPIDVRAGHVPGAVNLPFVGNLNAQGYFLSPDALRMRFESVGLTSAGDAVVYCGSGITACHNLLAMEHAGFTGGRLFPGSWSAYAGSERPIATGPLA
ncbi:MAG: sulfurtransferase [Propioniciclava sp.]